MKLVSLLLISLSQISATPLHSTLSKLDDACNGTNPSCEAGLFCEPDHKKDKDCPGWATPGVCKQICEKDNECKEKDNICESYSGKKHCSGLDKHMKLCVKGKRNECEKDKDCKKNEICVDKKGKKGKVCEKDQNQ